MLICIGVYRFNWVKMSPTRDSSTGSISLHIPDGHHHHHQPHHHHNHVQALPRSSTMSSRQVYILKGEISLLLVTLRRNSQQRWSSHGPDPKNDYPLLKQLQALKEVLETEQKQATASMSKDANYFLVPFLHVIRSEDTSGPITVMALNSIQKFISYELVHEFNGGTAAVEAITDAVIHAHFVSSDSASDELVLAKILQVLHRLFTSPVGSLLSNEAVCELMQSSLRMCFIERANELLKKSAESALHDMVHVLFRRVSEFPVVFTKKLKNAESTYNLAIEVEDSPKKTVDQVDKAEKEEEHVATTPIAQGPPPEVIVSTPESSVAIGMKQFLNLREVGP